MAHTTKIVALGLSCRDLSIDASLGVYPSPVVEEANFKHRPRVCVMVSPMFYGRHVPVGLSGGGVFSQTPLLCPLGWSGIIVAGRI